MSILSRPATATRPLPSGLARALDAAYRRLESLIPDYHRHPARSAGRARWFDRVWRPAGEAASQAESAILAHLRRRGVVGTVADGKLYLSFSGVLGELADYRGTGLLVVELATIEGLAPRRPAAADWPDWTDRGHVTPI